MGTDFYLKSFWQKWDEQIYQWCDERWEKRVKEKEMQLSREKKINLELNEWL